MAMKKAEALSRLLALIDEQPASEELEEVLAVLSVPCSTCEGEKPLAEGWAFVQDFAGRWEIAFLQEQSPSARYITVTERKPDGDSHSR